MRDRWHESHSCSKRRRQVGSQRHHYAGTFNKSSSDKGSCKWSMSYRCIYITEDKHPAATTFPRTIGHEPAGEIVSVGEGVTSRKVGDRVGIPWVQATCGRCEWCLRGKPMFCQQQIDTSINIQGAHAEYTLAYADSTMALPEGLSYEQAPPVFCAGHTIWSGLR
jgi:dehydrogenase